MAAQKRRKTVTNAAGERGGAELLLEIGTEELPSHFIPPALQALADSADRLLRSHRLDHGPIRVFGTPRRLAVVVESLAARQTPVSKETMGPSRAVAFDATGEPTKAAIKFAESQGVAIGGLQVRETPKGEYVFAVKHDPGRHTAAVLAEVIPALVRGLSFPKAMRWDESGIRFGRPIRWLLAVYGGKVISVTIGRLKSGDRTFGHRFLGVQQKQGLRATNFTFYKKELERRGVIVDQERRRALIVAQLEKLTKSAGGHLHRDEALLEHAVYTVEYPQAILGEFNLQYLALPKEVLITAMKEHQGYFSLVRRDGSLLPRFIAVTNMKLPNMGLIREGNERVLAARLADAKFFFDEDRKVKLADRVEKLKGVTFHQKLGTLYQKQVRVTQLAALLVSRLSVPEETLAACRRAAQLCKADLVTGMVGEFPVLQGMMGGEYARHDGEPEEVGRAIAEQYLPHSMEGELPQTLAGKVLSLADRLDSLAAFFHVGLVPTGSEDPFGLRRHAAAVVRILVEGNLRLDLRQAVDHAKTLVADNGFKAVVLPGQADPLEFIFDRLRYYGGTVHRLRDDVMEAVLKPTALGLLDLVDVLSRMKALQGITTRPEFDPLMVGFKRAHRMVEKENWTRTFVEASLFEHPTEEELYKAVSGAKERVPALIVQGAYSTVLDEFVRLKPAIDDFFVGVLVNTDKKVLRENRLSLLRGVDDLFGQFADFSRIMVQAS